MAERRQGIGPAGLQEPCSPERSSRWAASPGCEDGNDAVLSLSHFSRPPFLSFGSVRVGTWCVRRLAVENPNAEPVHGAVYRPPPASKGFTVEQDSFLLQPGERIYILITWTPLEGGKVRELITFIINDVVKHRAVLLGNAEQPITKKKNLWDTIKRRIPAQSRKRVPVIKSINKTFQMSEQTEKNRSPLQSCENLEVSSNRISPNGNSLVISEHKLSISPINPINQKNQHVIYTPLSSTYSVPEAPACHKLLNNITETPTVTTLYDNVLEKKKVHQDNVINSAEINASSVCTPEQLNISSNRRKILSPDSFINNSYEVTEELDAAIAMPILSPDQFLRENQIVTQPNPECKPMSFTSDVKSCISTAKFSKQKEKIQVVSFFMEPQLSMKAPNETNERNPMTCSYDKIEQNVRSKTSNQACCLQNKKRPLLSSTVTKTKPNPEGKETKMLKLKSKKSLSNAIEHCMDIIPRAANLDTLPRLPVIESVSNETKCIKDKASFIYLESSSHNRKRKSGEYLEEVKNGREEYAENLGRKRTLKSCDENGSKSGLKFSVSKYQNGDKQKTRSGSASQKSKNFKRTKNIVPVAQSQLTFVKPLKTDIPRHPMPFAAKNMFYDEQWKEKQQRGFTWWLNFVLTPDDFTLKTDISQVNTSCLILGTETYKSSVPKAPTKEEASLRAYTTRCKLNKLRRSACRLFTCEEMVKAIKRLEIEIEAKRLLVRKDRHLWKDIGERQKILSWILCYNPLWLRIGLETIFGELIALESNSDVMSLAVFILNRLLWNPDIAAEYRHPTVPHLYRDGHEEALSKFTLKKLLLLVCFLDRAKVSRIIEHDPCLFFKNAEFKSSKEILLAFSRDFLSGEGDLSRHLGFLGFPVNHVQTPLDEFDFAVTNLATDLQCGIRLVRTLELLSSEWTLSKKLRVPAISRLQKMHNVKLAFEVLNDHGIQLKDEHGSTIDTKDIVDRHREKTFALLWKIVFAFQVNISLDVDQLKAEIAFLKNMQVTKLKRPDLESVSNMGNDISRSYSYDSYGDNVKLLMDWVNVVCGFYNIKVENFTVSFSDGRVLCYLIHHYHPCYVPLEAVCKRTTQTVECTRNGILGLNSSSESDASLNLINETFDQTISTSVLYKELLDNEKRNFQLINAAVSDLGGIPAMIQYSDMSNTIPDEKVVITYVSFLCSRLISLSKEIRAALLIQSTWRKYKLKIKLAETKKQTSNAVVVIQKHWRRYLAVLELQKLKKAMREETERIAMQRWQEAVIVLQAWYRMKRERRWFLKMSGAASVIQIHYRAHREQTFQRQKFLQIQKATLCLQASYRGFKIRRMLRHQHMAATKIQAMYRAHAARRKYQSLIQASIVIQRWYRTSKSGSKIRKKFQKTKAAAISLQAVLRGRQVRKWLQRQHVAAITIQSAYRKYKAMKRFRMVRRAALTIQQHYRAHILSKKQQQEYIVLRNSTILFQATWRGTIVRRQIERQHQAAVTIQSYYRMHENQVKFKYLRDAAVTIQRWYRAITQAHNAQQKYLALKEAAVKMQAIYRGLRERRKIQRMNQAAICIQAMFKMHRSNVQYRALKRSATIIQARYRAFCRGQKDRKKYLALRKSSLILQAAYRGMKIRQELRSRHQYILVIQSYYRMYRERKAYLKLVAATKVIQRWYRASRDKNAQIQMLRYKYKMMKISALQIQAAFRGIKIRVLLKKMHMAAIIIQRNFKAFVQRRKFIFLKSAAVTIQRRYRAKRQREKFLHLRRAVIVIQSTIRSLLVRRYVKQMHLAAAVIQATFRMHMAYTQYRTVKSACVVIQQHYRAYRKAKQARALYLKQRHSALILQAAYRGMKVRHVLKKKHEAAVVIQSNYRKHRQWKSYRNIQWAVRLIQVRVRANQEGKIAVQQYSSIKKAAICIQKAFRRMKARNQKRQEAAILLQRNFKMQRARKNYLTLRVAAISLQRRYRATVLSKRQREKFLHLRRAVIVIQSTIRSLLVRRYVKQMHLAAAVIQATFRMHMAYTQYRTVKSACVVIQQHCRAYRKGKQARALYLKQRRSALILQAAYRGMKVRHVLKKKHEAAVVIQSNYRKHRQWKSYRNIQWAVRLIQVRVRANQEGKIAVQQYSSIKKAAICIQKAFRRMKARNQKRQEAAILLQRNFKMQRARKNYLTLRVAAISLQRRYRATVLSKRQREKFLHLRRAVIVIQSTIRSLLVRRYVKQMHLAAAVIQATFRMHMAYTQYRTVKSACVVIQQHCRAYRKGKQARALYLKQRRSALILQAAYRGMKVRHVLKKKHEAAVVIQSNYRKHRQWKSYRNIQWAVRLIQVRVRANQEGKIAVQQYSSIKKAAICIQKAFRRMKARNQKRQEAAILLQRNFKMQRARKNYLTLRVAAISLQRRYRATVLSKRQREKFLHLRRAVIVIQSTIRSLLVRRYVKQMHLAAAVIQATFRMHMAYTQYRTVKSACVVIQQHCRAYRKAKQARALYLKQRRSALILQAAYRGMKVRHVLKKKHEAAVVIQSNYRKHRQWKSYRNIQWAVRLIQVRVRANQEGKIAVQQYSSIKKAAICIQKAFRRMKARNQKRQEAAILLQRNFKMQRARKNYLTLRVAAISLQRRYRATVLSKRQREKFLHLRRAVIVIQSTIRSLLVRRYVKQMHLAAAVIQATFRMHMAYTQYRTVKSACVVIQQHCRAYRKGKQARALYLKQRRSALILQAAYRGMKVRHVLKKKHEAAVVIQSNYRKHRQWKSYRNIQWAVRLIQVRVRANQEGKIAVQQYSSIKKAAICIQKAFRRMKARNQKRQEAAILLQRNFKMQRARKNYLTLKAAAISLQRRYRALFVMRKQAKEYASVRAKIICVQSFYRGFKIRKEVKRQHLAATVIQATFRMYKVKLAYQKLRYATVTMQKYYRSHLKEKHQNTHQTIQKSIINQVTCRGTKIQPELDTMHVSATIIQSVYRMYVQQKHYKLICWAVIIIQSAYRGMVARKIAKKMHAARNRQLCPTAVNCSTEAIESKSQCQTNEATEQYQKYWKAAVLIQQHYRFYLTTKHHSMVYLLTHKRIILLQATVRGFIERQRFSRMKRSTIKIQRWYRGNWQRRKYLQYRKKIIIIQRMVRRWISRRTINTAGIPKDINPQIVSTGVTKFQALWRGYSWRKKTDTPETRSLRDSLIIANKESKEEKKLCNRTSVAIDYLLRYKHFSYILTALKDLEVVTRLSPVCCENMAQSKAVCTIFTLIRSCNRSVPSMDVIKYSVQVLLNLSKYERTTDAVYSVENSVGTLLDLLQMYRERAGDRTSEKSGSIFTKTCCLFAHLSKDSRRASEIRNNHKVVASLRRLFKLTARKHQMDVQRMLAKQKLDAYINGQSSIPVKVKIISRQRPDWDLRKDNIREIVDPLQAIEMVMNTLGISCN